MQTMLSKVIYCFIFVLCSVLIVQVQSQACNGITPNTGICTDRLAATCSELVPCEKSTNLCNQSDHQCVHHPQCQDSPVCYPIPTFNQQFCPPTLTTTTTTTAPTTTIQQSAIPNITGNATSVRNGVTVAGGIGSGNATNQLHLPSGLVVDDDQTVIIADTWNHRIIQWKKDDTNGQVVAGGKGLGNRMDQLNYPSDVLIDKVTNSFLICDQNNRRVVRWSRRSSPTQGEILINNIFCYGLFMDDQRYLYVSDIGMHEVRRYQMSDTNGILVAGGNRAGSGLNQFKLPAYLFVDRQQNVYVSDRDNNRVMKWGKGATEGIIVAGDQEKGSALTQLSSPHGLFIDTLGAIHVVDSGNHRVIRWVQADKKQGTVMVGGNDFESRENQFYSPEDLSFGPHGNLYVTDKYNHRVQRFSLE
ncbi:unnamed protein product [Rotaria socialis]|uniref:Uncharacterized protein n=1 Tax=Rotaria socialis TaxID=392032 RepID=A0A818G2A2_9BILA|nr:unnamed protein product [Rotaria socialis]